MMSSLGLMVMLCALLLFGLDFSAAKHKLNFKKTRPSPPPDLNREQLKAAIASGDPVFVKFYAPWCGHCKAMHQPWETLTAANGPGTLLSIDCTTDGGQVACEFYGIESYPTLIAWINGKPKIYEGRRDALALADWIGGWLRPPGQCIARRATDGCDPHGDRTPASDRACGQLVTQGVSGGRRR